MIAAITLKVLDPFGTGKLVLFQVTYDKDWHAYELLPFLLLGVFGGVYGAYFSKLNYSWSKHVRNKTWLKTHPIAEVFLVCSHQSIHHRWTHSGAPQITAVTTGLAFINPFTGMSGTELVYHLFAECRGSKPYQHAGLCMVDPRSLSDIMPLLRSILTAMIVRACLTIITFGIKLPAGIFIPSLGVGACAGRVLGLLMQWLQYQEAGATMLPICGKDKDCIIPGLYAMVGAAATLSGVTRTTVSLAVIMFELTDTLTYAVPVMLSVLVAKTVADALEPKGIYDLVIELNQLPYLDSKHEYLWGNLHINDVTAHDTEVIELDKKNTVTSLRDQLVALMRSGNDDSGFPILRPDINQDGMRMVGYIGANELEHALSLVADGEEDEVHFHTTYSHFNATSSVSSLMEESERREGNLFDFSIYMDQAPLTVQSNSPLEMVHQFFAKLGARYVVVTDSDGLYEGVIDKKTWVAFLSDLEEKSPSLLGDDPYQLDRLADELANRESSVSRRKESDVDVQLNMPELPASIPLSHDNVFLTSPNFLVEDFLLSRSNISLPDLRSDLREYLSQLKEELVMLINDDYEAFISLSTDLKDEGGRLLRLRTPLKHLKSEVHQSRAELQVIQDAIQQKLRTRAILREEKALLHLLLKISESTTRLESLLLIASPENEISGSPNVSSITLPPHVENRESTESRAQQENQIAWQPSEAFRTRSLGIRAVAISHLESSCGERIDRIQSTISSDLDHVFATLLIALVGGKGEGKVSEMEGNKLIVDVTECMRTYDILGLWRDAEDVLRKEVIRPFVKKASSLFMILSNTINHGALIAPQSPIIPHTPFVAPRAASLQVSTPLPPRTPYTPFTAHASVKHHSYFTFGSTSTSPYAHLLEDTDDPLATLYAQALRFVERDLYRIMSISETVSIKSLSSAQLEKEKESPLYGDHPTNGFDIMANVVWEELGRALIDELGGIIFSSGRPSDFKKHYELSEAFIRSLEYLSPSVQSIRNLRAHPLYVAFQQRWQLPVYFQMRWKEIVGPLEEALSVLRIESNLLQADRTFSTSQANAVWLAIAACWSAEIFISDLCHRFWKLTLQILSRYKTWLDKCVSKGDTADKASSPTQNRASTPVQAHDTLSTENTAADDSTLRQNVAMMVDIKALRTHVLTLWREEISMMLPEISDSETDGAQPQDTLHNSLNALTNLIAPLSSDILGILTRRCCDALLPVRSIPSQFRAMSNKRIPTEPSYFVASILRPVKLFFGIGVGDGVGYSLKDDCVQTYSVEIFENVAQRYMYYLTAMKKTEESLRRLKKGKKTSFSLFGSANAGKDDDSRDEERIRAQMILDVEAFGKDAESLGVVLQHNEAYVALREMVQTLEAPESM
ncbi:hypothetical protein H0H93_012389 [Arthromyces matolae]|nr:hypothetical protein H0H93_012389 [Arthromyces matolae]